MKILSRPKGNAEEYGRWSVNPYVGCPHECRYCYLKKGVWSKTLGGNVSKLKAGLINDSHAFHIAIAEIIEHQDEIIRDGGLFMSFTTDPCLMETYDLFSNINFWACHYGIPVTILTKCAYDIPEKCTGIPQRPCFSPFCISSKMLAIGWTLTGHDELEPNASPNSERLRYMKIASDKGMITWASIEPVIDFPSSLDMIKKAVDAGCRHFKIGLLTSNTRVCRDKYDVVECVKFTIDVLHATNGRATVYWKQSVRDLLTTVYTPTAINEILDQPNAVGKDFNMFNVNAEF